MIELFNFSGQEQDRYFMCLLILYIVIIIMCVLMGENMTIGKEQDRWMQERYGRNILKNLPYINSILGKKKKKKSLATQNVPIQKVRNTQKEIDWVISYSRLLYYITHQFIEKN